MKGTIYVLICKTPPANGVKTLIPDSKLPKADGYQNEDSVAMVLSTSPYNITDNVLYAGNVTTQPPTVYDGISKFSQYAKTEHD